MATSPGSQTATLTQPAASASTAVLLTAGRRNGFIITNDGSTVLFLAFAATATVTAYTIQIAAAGSYSSSDVNYSGVVSGIWSGSPTGNARVTVW
jgi:hypothetical protein